MSTIKISDLPEVSQIVNSDYILIVRGGVTYKVLAADFTAYQLEQRTTDYSATAANEGKMWLRTDLTETVRIVVRTGASTYAVRTFTLS